MMEDKTLYQQILGIQAPWEIVRVDLNVAGKRVDLYVEWPRHISAPCPECQAIGQAKSYPIHDRRQERAWRHLDTCQMKTIIHCKIPRVSCPEHGVKTITVSWAENHSRFTILFEGFALHLLKTSANRSQTAKILRISWDEMHHIMAKGVARGLSRRVDEPIPFIGIDEKSFLSGHHYVTVLTDIQGKRVIDVAENRDTTAVNTLWQGLTSHQREQVEAVCMDFWKAYRTGVSVHASQADIVHDRFHVVKYLNEAVDKVRRKEHKDLLKNHDKRLVRSKYLWLKNPESWSVKEKNRFVELTEDQLAVGRAWNRKELFRKFWSSETVSQAEAFFKCWYFSATHSRLKPVIEVAKLLKRHLDGLLAWIKYHISNGLSEGFNAKIQQIKSIARGFRNFKNYRVAILFHLGGLDMIPQ